MLSRLTIENFKGIGRTVSLDLKPITVLFGPNSAGKSSVIQALQYAQELFWRHNADSDRTTVGGEAVDLGGFLSFVHNRDPQEAVQLGFELNLTDADLPFGSIDPYDDAGLAAEEVSANTTTVLVDLTVSWSELRSSAFVRKYSVGFNGEPFATIETKADGHTIDLTYLNLEHDVCRGDEAARLLGVLDDLRPATTPRCPHPAEALQRTSGSHELVDALPGREQKFRFATRWYDESISFFDDVERSQEENERQWQQEEIEQLLWVLIHGPAELVAEAIEDLRYLGPLRKVPPRNFEQIRSPDSARWASGLAAWDVLHRSDERFIQRVNHWMTDEGLNTGYRFEQKRFKELRLDSELFLALARGGVLDEDLDTTATLNELPTRTRLLLLDDNNGLELAPPDVGIGISQAVPVVVLALDSTQQIVAIEQPELHVHPALQTALGDLFIEATAQGVQLLVETHSEHLMLRFLRRIRETTERVPGAPHLTTDQIAVHFIEPSTEGVAAHRLNIDETGDFTDPWPGGFFDERYGELY